MTPTFEQIQEFLNEAKRHGYDVDAKSLKITDRPGVDVVRFPKDGNPQSEEWFWEDAWVGSNPFSGTTTVWYKGNPCWQNHYWGYVVRKENAEFIYEFLKSARRQTWKTHVPQVAGAGQFKGLHYEEKKRRLPNEFDSQMKYERISRNGKTIGEVFETKGVV
jgi:hypothetical protein